MNWTFLLFIRFSQCELVKKQKENAWAKEWIFLVYATIATDNASSAYVCAVPPITAYKTSKHFFSTVLLAFIRTQAHIVMNANNVLDESRSARIKDV